MKKSRVYTRFLPHFPRADRKRTRVGASPCEGDRMPFAAPPPTAAWRHQDARSGFEVALRPDHGLAVSRPEEVIEICNSPGTCSKFPLDSTDERRDGGRTSSCGRGSGYRPRGELKPAGSAVFHRKEVPRCQPASIPPSILSPLSAGPPRVTAATMRRRGIPTRTGRTGTHSARRTSSPGAPARAALGRAHEQL
jgi:hypothetical protein